MDTMKAQSAMEYLMTYGWAILIVIIVAAALYALGIFNPATYTGRIPTGFTTLGTPTDWNLDSSGDFSIILTNRLNNPVTVWNMTIEFGSSQDFNESSIVINPSSEYSYPATQSLLNLGSQTVGSTYSVEVSILYGSAGALNHTERGTLTGTVSS
jgi:hypothetical protein